MNKIVKSKMEAKIAAKTLQKPEVEKLSTTHERESTFSMGIQAHFGEPWDPYLAHAD